MRKRVNLEAPLYTFLPVISVTIFEKIEIQTEFSQSDNGYDTAQDDNQLDLFGFQPDDSAFLPNAYFAQF